MSGKHKPAYNVRLSPKVRAKAAVIANAEHRTSIAEVVREAMRQYIADYERKYGKIET